MPRRTDGRRPLAAALIVWMALALGVAGPASAATSAKQVDAPAGSVTPSALPELPREPVREPEAAAPAVASEARPLPIAVQVPMAEDPAEVAAARAATLPATRIEVPAFLILAAVAGLLGLGLCVAAVLRA